ncbi:thiamine phosphate synthase [Tepidicella baoligensis]|uniref:thiamine phosphate synthase n=1 Tax=Tepidicella baoligensis TaxID=2707016 RepID=UPI0015DA8DE1
MTTSLQSTLAIVERHAALGLPSHTDPEATPANDSPHAIAFAAARRLGFIPADAECVAQAWQRQTERTGRFDIEHWPCEAADFGLHPLAPEQAFAAAPMELGVYAVLPDAEWVGRMARAGLPTLQLRFKSTDTQAVRREIRAAIDAVAGTGAHLYINDHWEEAMTAGAYGVHLGQEDLDSLTPEQLARLRAAGLRLGLSTHGYAEMLRAEAVGPSYVALGAVFPTTLKAMPTPPQGLGRLGAYARLLRHRPLVAIGGIAAKHLSDVAATGVGSFAVVRAITAAADPQAAAHALQARWAALRGASKS